MGKRTVNAIKIMHEEGTKCLLFLLFFNFMSFLQRCQSIIAFDNKVLLNQIERSKLIKSTLFKEYLPKESSVVTQSMSKAQ